MDNHLFKTELTEDDIERERRILATREIWEVYVSLLSGRGAVGPGESGSILSAAKRMQAEFDAFRVEYTNRKVKDVT